LFYDYINIIKIKIYRTIIFTCFVCLRKIFGPKRDEVTGEWRGLHSEELYALYSSPSIIWVIESRRMTWAEHVACMGHRRGTYRVLVGRLEGKNHLEDLGIDERMILK
jgi:hypothetical protein